MKDDDQDGRRAFRAGLKATGLSHEQVATKLHLSRRQLGRYLAGDSAIPVTTFHWLAREVFPRDAQLAAKLAWHGQVKPEGILPPSSAARVAVTEARLIDLVVYAAAHAADISPRAAREAVAAAIAAVKELGLSPDAVLATLRPPVTNVPVPPRTPKRSGP